MMRWVLKSVVGLLIVAAVICVGDFGIFKLRGSPAETVTVSLFVSAPLKNNKIELDFTGQEQWACSKTLFPVLLPQPGMQPCWYLKKHTNQIATY
jgi:hypothetical protein